VQRASRMILQTPYYPDTCRPIEIRVESVLLGLGLSRPNTCRFQRRHIRLEEGNG